VIWHFLEVWLLVAVSFAVGCGLGAGLYGLLSDSPLALAQGAVADAVGDAVDWLKVRLGIGPTWRPELARSLSRQGAAPAAERVEPSSDFDPPPPIDREREASFLAIALSRPLAEEPEPEPEEPIPPDEIEPEVLLAPDPTPRIAAPESRRSSLPAVVKAPRPTITPMRPAGLSKPRGGVPDSLTRIRGIGQRNEEVLNTLGIYHFSQIAAWTPGEVLWVGRYLAFPERVERDDWVSQAMLLATGGDTGFEKSAERRRRRRVEARLRQAIAADPPLPPPALPGPPTPTTPVEVGEGHERELPAATAAGQGGDESRDETESGDRQIEEAPDEARDDDASDEDDEPDSKPHSSRE